MDTSKIIKGVVNSGRYTVTAPIIKEDYGLYLQIEGVELPQTYEVDFSNSEHNGTSVTMIGNSDGVLIPHQFIDTGKDIFAFLYHVGANYGRTVYKFRIPNKVRPDRTDDTPTPEQASVIDQAISALNTAVDQTAQDVIDADASAQASAKSARASANSAVQASLSESNAERAKGNAQASAESASVSATASAQSASEAETARQATTSLVAEAQGYANASEQSATASANSAEQAESAKGVAQSYAQDAQTSATYASVSESTASTKASEASGYASTASAKATESAQSASQALTYKTDAESAKTASQTAQGLAESARDSAISAKNDAESARNEAQNIVDGISAKAEQIDSNTERIESLEDDRYKPYVVDSASGSIASFPDGADDIPLKSLVVNINPVQDLHGYDSPWVAGGGVNKLPPMVDGTYTGNGVTAVVKDGVATLSGTTTASGNALIIPLTSEFIITDGYLHLCNSAVNSSLAPSFEDASSVSTSSVSWSLSPANRIGTIPSNRVGQKWNRIRFYIASGVTISGTFSPMVCADNAARSYSPYENICPISGWTGMELNANGTVILINWQTEAGTVYDGKLDVLTGKLTVYPYYASYNGETLTGEWISDRDVYAVGTTPTIGAQVVNIGAEGTEYQLEPHEVASLLGVNNVWADTGDTEVTYRADPTLYIQRLTEPDADMIADSNIVSGQYFMVGNNLYKATANIASGASVIVGTNAIRKSLSEALNEINA